jgi:hypothetical protein
MGNPILMVTNGGTGETPVPANALIQPGEKIGLHRDGEHTELTVLAVCPAGECIDYAVADQNGQPRPLTVREIIYDETVYVFTDNGRELLIGHAAMARGKSAADSAGLNIPTKDSSVDGVA